VDIKTCHASEEDVDFAGHLVDAEEDLVYEDVTPVKRLCFSAAP